METQGTDKTATARRSGWLVVVFQAGIGHQFPPGPDNDESIHGPHLVSDGKTGVTGPSLGSVPLQLDLGSIRKVKHNSQEAVELKVDEVRIDLSLIRQDLRGVTGRVAEAEKSISTQKMSWQSSSTRLELYTVSTIYADLLPSAPMVNLVPGSLGLATDRSRI
ncbi:hypothetical protein NDU88_001032 [Pleurodeles waltl]|uniref:Uncharacterized protein n=1 Tax=Pleurodeles waltl TaxID=8319 RepID=A0AAV7TH45_PLEWA|nr:hypothetical protein NDU88_001032 [Pleurodeles waltl]